MLPSVGWIGLGNMGSPMARRVLAAGFPLHVWARRRESASPLVDAGARWTASPEALAACCDIVVTMVAGPDDVLELHQRLLPNARRGSIALDMSTAAPRTASALQPLAASAGVCLLDCPVTGGVDGARNGKLTSFVGGDDGSLARARPLLEVLSKRIVHCGPPGAGYRMKLVNQAMIAGVFLGLAEGAALARLGGFDAQAVLDALAEGTASGPLLRSYLPRMMPPGGEVTFTVGMLRKDLRLAREQLIGDAQLLDLALSKLERACATFGDSAGVQALAAPDPGAGELSSP